MTISHYVHSWLLISRPDFALDVKLSQSAVQGCCRKDSIIDLTEFALALMRADTPFEIGMLIKAATNDNHSDMTSWYSLPSGGSLVVSWTDPTVCNERLGPLRWRLKPCPQGKKIQSNKIAGTYEPFFAAGIHDCTLPHTKIHMLPPHWKPFYIIVFEITF